MPPVALASQVQGVVLHAPLLPRLMARINRRGPSECWPWTAQLSPTGYPRMSTKRNGKSGQINVLRALYELSRGPLPDSIVLDHLCRNRACLNLAHVEPVSNRENILRGFAPSAVNARKTHCIRGHKLTGANLYITRDGRRQCRPCRTEAMRRWEAAKSCHG
jgi:hypothetical protein